MTTHHADRHDSTHAPRKPDPEPTRVAHNDATPLIVAGTAAALAGVMGTAYLLYRRRASRQRALSARVARLLRSDAAKALAELAAGALLSAAAKKATALVART